MKIMYEDANGVMVPNTVALREVYHAFHYGPTETVIELFGDTGPLNEAPCLEPIEDDSVHRHSSPIDPLPGRVHGVLL